MIDYGDETGSSAGEKGPAWTVAEQLQPGGYDVSGEIVGDVGLMSSSSLRPLRVQFREGMLQRRKEEREARQLDCLKEEEQRQNRLEALRNQVGHYKPITFFHLH